MACAYREPASVGKLTRFGSPGRDWLIISAEESSLKLERKKSLARALRAGILAAACLVAVIWKPLAAGWYANLGAVQMARSELAGFPSGSWDLDQKQKILETSAGSSIPGLFIKAVQIYPGNVTAEYRLGLISLYQNDFKAALLHLQRAYQAAPDHRGIIKVLGYCYVWTDQIDQALPLLQQIPEAGKEMEVYAWWWIGKGSADIADRSAKAALLLANAQNPNPK
jgi:tetratricopeptide (TPR) repeat protein